MLDMAKHVTSKLQSKGMSQHDNTLPSFLKRVLDVMVSEGRKLAAQEREQSISKRSEAAAAASSADGA